MGLIDGILGAVFGSGRNVVRETVEVFRENAEAGAQREADAMTAVLAQHGAEFRDDRNGFDRFIDGLNRVPRPAMAFGTLALFASAMVDPIWFAERMQGLALVPEALWWLLGAIVSFYFGARHQLKGQEFQREIVQTMTRVPQVAANIETLRKLRADSPGAADTKGDAALELAAATPDSNPALEEWRQGLRKTA